VCVGSLGARAQEAPAKDVQAYLKRNKNDAVDAVACREAVHEIDHRGNLLVDAPQCDSSRRSPYGTSMRGAGADHHIKCGLKHVQQHGSK